jgi:hypothetical protein
MRQWPEKIIEEIKRIIWEYSNVGKEKIYPLLFLFCQENSILCPKEKTIGRIIADLGGLRIVP